MKRFYLTCLALTFSGLLLTYGQTRNTSISFDKETYDFGKIEESNGSVSCRFDFLNAGAVPLIISNVTTSCGCTASDWSREPVLPGSKGYIKVTYDPRNRPGKFEKTITVTSNAEGSPSVLHISGEVNGKTLSIEKMLPVQIGSTRLKTNIVSFGEMTFGEQKNMRVDIMNMGSSSVKLSFIDVPSYIIITTNPTLLKPGETGVIDFTINPEAGNRWGNIADRIQLLLNGKAVQGNHITITANVTENFSKLSPKEIANAPVISADKTSSNFGTIKQGKQVTVTFTLKNTGKSNLMIHDVTTSCDCTVGILAEKTIKPGKTTDLKVRFDSKKYKGDQNKMILVISNDPKNPKLILWLKGMVIE